MDKRKKIGIMGGTFDPPHFGHLLIAEAARDSFSLDAVMLMPSGRSYFKDNQARRVTDKFERLEMTLFTCVSLSATHHERTNLLDDDVSSKGAFLRQLDRR